MAQALVCGTAASQHSSSLNFFVNKQASAILCCTARRLNCRKCRTCAAYQQEVEETFRPKAPSTAPGPDTTRRPPPPPPPPPPASPSGQVSPIAVCCLNLFVVLHHPYVACSSRVRRAELCLLWLAYARWPTATTSLNIPMHHKVPMPPHRESLVVMARTLCSWQALFTSPCV